MNDLHRELVARGFLQDATPGLTERLAAGPIVAYAGFDPTADSLHVGSLVPIMGLAWLQRFGGRPIALVGGGTAMVGDPSGKRAERPMLTPETIESNSRAIALQLRQFLAFEGPAAAQLRNNAEWLGGVPLLGFLRDVGKHFTVNYLLQKEAVRTRMETGISFTEFSYVLIQAYDFWHLFSTTGCELQVGGSDQWGNITAGIELIARREQKTAHGLVFPLLETASGTKFGKSEEGNVWLDPARTSPYRFYQFWLNTDDRDVESFLKLFTFLPLDRIGEIMAEQAADPGRRTAQRTLAADVTARVHGLETTERVIAASRILFGGIDLASTTADVLEVVAGEVPVFPLSGDALAGGVGLVDALTTAGLASSKSDARRGLQQRGFSVNGDLADDAQRTLGAGDLIAGRYIVLQKGRKNYALLRVER